MTKYKNIAIAGVGVVGTEVLNYLQQNQKYIANNCTNIVPIVKAISTRTERSINEVKWYNNPQKFFTHPDKIDLIVELIGGEDGVAHELIQTALSQGIDVVTANKALIAKHGNQLHKLAQKNNAALHYEASVGGAIPIIKTLSDNLATNEISEISGILNGTCNFILSLMLDEDIDFDKALKLAQEKGYAEADPTLDIDGIDTAHKIAILSSIAFKTGINFNTVKISGIRDIKKSSLHIAKKLKHTIKLLARTVLVDKQIYQYVLPFFIPNSHPLSSVNLSLNSLFIKSNLADTTVLTGHGAGGKPTASAIISDIGDVLKNHKIFKVDIANDFSYAENLNLSQKYILHTNSEKILNSVKDALKSNDISIIKEDIIDKNYVIIIESNKYNFISNLENDYNIDGWFGIL